MPHSFRLNRLLRLRTQLRRLREHEVGALQRQFRTLERETEAACEAQAGVAEGLSLEEALAKAAMFVGIVQGTTLVWAPIWGFILDRIDRLSAVALGMALAAAGYIWVGVSPSPIAIAFIPAAILLGVGEISAMLSGGALIGQEAPVDIRGSVLGVFNLCGSVGILCITLVAGYVFDAWMPGGPFIVVGIINLCVCAVAITVRKKVGYRSPRGE